MRILVVCQHYKPEPFNVSDICGGLVGRGHDVTVLTGLPNCPSGIIDDGFRHGARRNEVMDGVRVHRVPIIARGKDLSGVNKLRRVANYVSFPFSSWLTRACVHDAYDCVLCVQYSPVLMALPALRIAKRQGIPCLIYCFDLWPEDLLTGGMGKEGAPYRAMLGVSRRIYSSATRIAITSPGFSEYFRRQLEIVEPDCVWLPQYAEESFEKLGEQPNMNSGSGWITVTFAGNVGGNQAVETIVRAAALCKDVKGLRVRIAGSGSHLETCKALAFELRADNVEFLGHLPLDAMPKIYGESDAMLLSLARPNGDSLVPVYTIPRKLQSYLASGKPVIVSARGVVADIVTSEECGRVCPSEDAEALAEVLKDFAALSSETRTEMGRRARSLYESQYSRTAFFERLEAVLGELGAENRDEKNV